MDLHLDTNQRSSGAIATATWNIKSQLKGSTIALMGANFFYTRYPVSAHSFLFAENGSGTVLTASIAAGNYGGNNYAETLQTAMNAAGANDYTVTFSAVTGVLTITKTTGTSVSILAQATNTARYTGFSTVRDFGNVHVGSTFVDLGGPLYVDAIMTGSNPGMDSEGSTLLARIPLNGLFGDFISYDSSTDPVYLGFSGQSNAFAIKLIDQFGEFFDNRSDIIYQFRIK